MQYAYIRNTHAPCQHYAILLNIQSARI